MLKSTDGVGKTTSCKHESLYRTIAIKYKVIFLEVKINNKVFKNFILSY